MRRPRGLDTLLAAAGLPPRVRADLLRRMTAPGRHYHDLGHLALLWQRHRRHGGPGGRAGRLVAAAIAYHDAVLDPRRADNEARSAALFRRVARQAGFTPAEAREVAATIEATADHLAARLPRGAAGRLRRWVLDLDLTPIAEVPDAFRNNTRLLRLEARHLDEAAWEAGRIGFLRGLAAAPRLFRDPRLARAYGPAAARNLRRELDLGA